MIHPDLFEILCCPETRQRVREAPASLLASLAEAARSGELKTGSGAPLAEPPDGGFVREDGRFLYPVRNGIPIMLVEERIPVPGAADAPEPDGEPSEPAGEAASDDEVQGDGDSDHHQVESGPGA